MIYKSLLLGLLAGTLACPWAFANSSGTADTTGIASIRIELGERDFRGYCAACHGVSGRGDGTLAEFLTIVVPDITKLTKKNAGRFPRERVMEMIDGRADVRIHGDRDMPVWGDWFDKEAVDSETGKEEREQIVSERINSLIAYIESLQSK